MDTDRTGPATDQTKGARKTADREPPDDKKVQVDRKEESERSDASDEAERAAERAQEERERSQF